MSSSAANPLKILIVEDHELARYGLSMALAEQEGVRIVGEAENGREGVEMAMAEKPDIVLMDIGMPEMNGITATGLIKKSLPETRVVVLTSISNETEVLASMAAGADAFCMKEIKMDRLFQVLQMVMEGALWLDPAVARVVAQSLPGAPGMPEKPGQEAVSSGPAVKIRNNTLLTDREQEVLQLIVDGKSNKEIAQALAVSSYTAKAHVSNIIQKLAVDDRTQAAVKALREGLVPEAGIS
ncbi:MAG: response regulator [Candidatus Melainabacteria bacterium]